ncbi:response regulator receiver protein [Melittangium boletus]|uniref:J domain-containing protein n=1 Tax=Melittangium boletus DSM 14713 TaxID=1294270 RepID=A0A250IJY4_9BACT|nr:response regulator receiver protein [Melittangium boletus]ATB31512.1 hypothetical protein MEBOL_004975 [Melittangium boletus DSM 14713]
MAEPVLLVHDDIATIASVRRLLTREGYEVILATSVADALIGFGHHLPVLIVLAPGVESGRGHLVLEELGLHPDMRLARVLLLGDAVPGSAAPVAPLPLDGAGFVAQVAHLIASPAGPESWFVVKDEVEVPASPTPMLAGPPGLQPRTPSPVRNIGLEQTLFTESSLEDSLPPVSPFALDAEPSSPGPVADDFPPPPDVFLPRGESAPSAMELAESEPDAEAESLFGQTEQAVVGSGRIPPERLIEPDAVPPPSEPSASPGVPAGLRARTPSHTAIPTITAVSPVEMGPVENPVPVPEPVKPLPALPPVKAVDIEVEARAEAERLAQWEIDSALAREQAEAARKAGPQLGDEGFFDVELTPARPSLALPLLEPEHGLAPRPLEGSELEPVPEDAPLPSESEAPEAWEAPHAESVGATWFDLEPEVTSPDAAPVGSLVETPSQAPRGEDPLPAGELPERTDKFPLRRVAGSADAPDVDSLPAEDAIAVMEVRLMRTERRIAQILSERDEAVARQRTAESARAELEADVERLRAEQRTREESHEAHAVSLRSEWERSQREAEALRARLAALTEEREREGALRLELEQRWEQRATSDAQARVQSETRGEEARAARAAAEARAEAEARSRQEWEARAHGELKSRQEWEARAHAEMKARKELLGRMEQEARARTEAEARARVEAEARAQAEQRAEAEARARADVESRARSTADARVQLEMKARAEAEARALAADKARSDAEAQAEVEARARARLELSAEAAEKARQRAEARANKAEQERVEALSRAESLVKARGEAQARAEAEALLRAELEERIERVTREHAEREAESERSRRDLEARVERVTREHAERDAQAERLRRELEARTERMTGEHSDREAEAERLRRELEARLERMTGEHAEREAEAERSRQELEARVERLTGAYAELETQAEELERARVDAETRAMNTERLRLEAEARVERAAQARATAQDRADEAEQRVASAERLRVELEGQVENSVKALGAVEAQAEELERARVDAETRAVNTERLRVELEARVERLEKERAVARTRAAEEKHARVEAEARLARLEETVAERSAHLDEARAESERLARSLAQEREAREALSQEISRLESSRAEAERSHRDAEARVLREASETVARVRSETEAAIARAEAETADMAARARAALISFQPPEGPAVDIPRGGSVSGDGLARLVTRLREARIQVRFELKGTRALRVLWLKDGALVGAVSSASDESLVDRARADGLIDARQENELRLVRGTSTTALLEAMRGRGYLRENEVIPLVQRYTEQVALDALAEDSSLYRLIEEAPPHEVALAASTRPLLHLLAEALRDRVSAETFMTAAGGLRAGVLRSGSEPEPESFGLSSRELRLLAEVDGEQTLEQLVLGAGLPQDTALRALGLCHALGLLQLRPAVPLEGDEDAPGELDVRRLESKYEEIQDADYFSVLGLARTAGGEDVRRAHALLTAEFHPLRFAGHPDPVLQHRAQQIATSLSEAARALADDRLREEYARSLRD